MLYVYLRFARGCSCKRARVSSRSQNGLRGENWERGRGVSAKDNHGMTNREANFSSSLKNKVQKSRINTSMTVQLISIRFDYTNSIPFFHHEISFPFLFLSLRSSFFSFFHPSNVLEAFFSLSLSPYLRRTRRKRTRMKMINIS